jgi:hypothetical protein
LFEGKYPRKFKAFATVAERKLQMLDDAYALEDLRVPPGNRLGALRGDRKGQWSMRINDIVRERRSITPDTALRLARYFGTTPQFWLNLQTSYDLKITEQEMGSKIEREVHTRLVA